MPGADQLRSSRERDKLTIAEVCPISALTGGSSTNGGRKAGRPGCIRLPNGSFRVRRSGYQRWLPSRCLAKP